jgi:hypothetical protein
VEGRGSMGSASGPIGERCGSEVHAVALGVARRGPERSYPGAGSSAQTDAHKPRLPQRLQGPRRGALSLAPSNFWMMASSFAWSAILGS